MEQLESIPLSNRDILQKLKGRTNVITYKQLNKVNNIEDVMKDNSVVV